jgi:hypothetical protein
MKCATWARQLMHCNARASSFFAVGTSTYKKPAGEDDRDSGKSFLALAPRVQ